jgi:hypothetical protein
VAQKAVKDLNGTEKSTSAPSTAPSFLIGKLAARRNGLGELRWESHPNMKLSLGDVVERCRIAALSEESEAKMALLSGRLLSPNATFPRT